MKWCLCLFSLWISVVHAQKIHEDEPVEANISRINFIEESLTLTLPSISNNTNITNTNKVIPITYTGSFENKIPEGIETFRLKERKMNDDGNNFKGFRIQIYGGLNSADAQKTRAAFIIKFKEKYPTYNPYSQPYYRIRVGDFVNFWEARKLQQDIIKDFPNAMVVQDNISLPRLR